MSTVSETTQQTLHQLLRCTQSGTIARVQQSAGGWLLYINDELIADEEIQLAVSVLEAQDLITWWPKYHPKQYAVLTLEKGRQTLADWDHRALLGGGHRLRLELVNDACCVHDGDAMDDCCATIHARDMCFKHYMRTRRHGDPTVTLLDRSHGATCSVPGCDRPYRSKGLCFMHWQRINSGRDLGPAEPINQRYGPDAKCSVSGCQRRPQRNWLCEMHADRLEDRGHVGGVDPERKPAGSGHVRADGYVEVRCSADHPLSRGGRTLLHRLILWSHIGLGPHPCNWCGCPVDWMYGLTDGALVVDHVDFDTTNNDPSNLVPACIVCNMNRPRL